MSTYPQSYPDTVEGWDSKLASMLITLAIGFLLAGLIGLISWWVGALSGSGALAATLSGGIIFGLGGLPWAALLLIFFISSSALSRLFSRRKADLTEKFSKGARRDWGQVLANGGLGALLAITGAVFYKELWPWIAYAGAMAAVNADTWATEIGVLSRSAPRLITNLKAVERGTSGGVTLAGYLAATLGAGLVATAAGVFSGKQESLAVGIAAVAGGLAGSSFDSLLGATVQSIYFCPNCRKETERHPKHSCGTETVPLRGWKWMNNDVVNFTCSVAGSIVAAGVWALIR